MPPLRRRITSDLFLALTSLAIAFLIWMIAKRSGQDQEPLVLGVRLTNVPPHIEARLTQQNVQAMLAFPKSINPYMVPGNFLIEIDWVDFPDPQTWCGHSDYAQSPPISIEAADLKPADSLGEDIRRRIGRQVGVRSIEPRRITAEARYHTRLAQIVVETKGRLTEGYRLAGPIVPNVGQTVLLAGSPDRFEELARAGIDPIVIATEEVDLSDRSQRFVAHARLILPEETYLIDPASPRIELDVPVEEVVEKVARIGEGVYIVGLDCHNAFSFLN